MLPSNPRQITIVLQFLAILVSLVLAPVSALAQGESASQGALNTTPASVTNTPAASDSTTPAIETYSTDLPEDGPWTLEFHPGIWYAGLSGDVKLPRSASGPSSVVDLVDDLDLDEPRVSPFGELNLAKGKWTIALRGFNYGNDGTATLSSSGSLGDVDFVPGSTLRSSFDTTVIEIEGGYRLYGRQISPMTGGGYRLKTDIRALVGARLFAVDYSVTNTSPTIGGFLTDSADDFAAHPLIGGKLNLDFYEDFSVTFQITAGALSDSYGFDIVVGGQWRPVKNVGVQIGYRALFFGMTSGSDNQEFEFEGSLQGLFAGVTFNF